MARESWIGAPTLWDSLSLGAPDRVIALPGVARVKASRGRKLDARSAPGADGGTIVDKGYKLAQVEVTVTIWTDEQYRLWLEATTPLLALRGRQRRPLRVYFPPLNDLGINEVYLEELTALEPSVQVRGGAWEATLKLVEYHPPGRGNATQTARAAASTTLAAATDRPADNAPLPPSRTRATEPD